MPAPIYTNRRTGERRRPAPGGAAHRYLAAHPDWSDGTGPAVEPVELDEPEPAVEPVDDELDVDE